jgi:hypothetical protein
MRFPIFAYFDDFVLNLYLGAVYRLLFMDTGLELVLSVKPDSAVSCI